MRSFHKILGLIMLLPFIAWAITGIFFYFKPGYQEAYQALSIKHYPVSKNINLPQHHNWLAVKQIKTILGEHLLVKNKTGWQQLNPDSFQPIDSISDAKITLLVDDAIKANMLACQPGDAKLNVSPDSKRNARCDEEKNGNIKRQARAGGHDSFPLLLRMDSGNSVAYSLPTSTSITSRRILRPIRTS